MFPFFFPGVTLVIHWKLCTGTLPESWGSMSFLESLNLASNNFTGMDPEFRPWYDHVTDLPAPNKLIYKHACRFKPLKV
jgi:hypothetical protein